MGLHNLSSLFIAGDSSMCNQFWFHQLAFACQTADSIVKRRHELENIVSSNEDKIDALEKQVRDAQFTNSESERKYEDISRKMATLEADAQRGNERAEGAEKKLIEEMMEESSKS